MSSLLARPGCRLGLRLCQLTALALWLATGPAQAAELDEDETTNPALRKQLYQGAFWGLQVHTGLVYRGAQGTDGPGFSVGTSARLASILSIADLQATLLYSSYSATPPTAGRSVDVSRVSMGAEGHFHPLFMTLLRHEPFWTFLASLWAGAGIDLDVTGLDGGGLDRTEVDFGWHIGAGGDYPLTDPDRGWAIWIGLAYRLKFLRVDTGVQRFRNFDEHTFLLTVGYRNNDIFFFRAPRPSELDHRDPPVRERLD